MKSRESESRQLERWVQAAQDLLPAVEMKIDSRGLLLCHSGKEVRLPASRIRAFERGAPHLEGSSYLDLSTGLLHIEAEGLLIHLQRPIPSAVLTPFLAALLGRLLLPAVFPTDFAPLPLTGQQVLLAKEWSRELSTEISPVAMNKLHKLLREEPLVEEDGSGRRELDFERCLALLVEGFRLGGIGRVESYFAPPEALERLERNLRDTLARGVTDTLSKLGGGWIEPRDFIAAPATIADVGEALGPPAPEGARETILVRRASRVPLALLCPRSEGGSEGLTLNPILAVAEALNSPDPVVRELGMRVRTKWLAR
jgi:hypothetical protein